MRILLDQNLPRQLAQLLPGHEVATASSMGWAEIGNGELIAAAEREGFGVMLTADGNIRYQLNLTGRQIALVVLSTNNWNEIREHTALIAGGIGRAEPGSYQEVALPRAPLLRRPPPERSS